MNGGQQFNEETSRKVEALYLTPDVVARRCQVLKTLELREDELVLDIIASFAVGRKAFPGKRRTTGLLNSPHSANRGSSSSASIVTCLLRTSLRPRDPLSAARRHPPSLASSQQHGAVHASALPPATSGL